MFSISAFNRTVILLSVVLLLAVSWGFFRVPEANLQMIVWGSLSSGLLTEVSSFKHRAGKAAVLACGSAAVQFLLSVSGDWPLGQIMLLTASAYFTFLTLSDHRAACVIMIVGCLSFFAPGGFLPAVSRSIDIFAALIVVMAVTSANCTAERKKGSVRPEMHYNGGQALTLAAELGIGAMIFRLLQLEQGAWILLTILFIRMSETPGSPAGKLAVQRASAVPAGIIAGGFLLGTFYRIDARIIYLVPFIGAAGFFILYNYGNFFLFSMLFMIAMTLFSDWMSGTYTRFDFLESFFSRSVSTLLGALLEILLHPPVFENKNAL